MVIRDSVEPILDDYRPAGISSLKFSKLSLGTVPPKIEGFREKVWRQSYRILFSSKDDILICLLLFCSGIRIQSFKKGQITMDVDFRWGGDPNIVLAVDTLVASLPIQVFKSQPLAMICKTYWSH